MDASLALNNYIEMCTSNKRFSCIIPKQFLCRYPLYVGAHCIGILMLCIMIAVAIVTLTQVLYIKNCEECSFFAWRNCFGYSITAFIYSITMLIINAWFLWGVVKKKSSVVISWVVVSFIWLAHTFCIMIVLICLYSKDTNLVSWVLSLVFGLIAIGIILYCLMVVIAFWKELKTAPAPATTV